MIAPKILLQFSLWNIDSGSLSRNFFVNIVFKFTMYDVHDLKANRLGHYLPLSFSNVLYNKQGNLNYHLFVLLEA